MPRTPPGRLRGAAQQIAHQNPTDTTRLDAFTLAVPEANFDISMLFHHVPGVCALDRFQLLLRGLCALNRRVTRAAMMEDRIELEINMTRLVLGQMDTVQHLTLTRPDTATASRQAGRLAYLLTHHDLALRLRIGKTASPDLLNDIAALAMAHHPPQAIILLTQGIVMTLAEFRSLDLTRLQPGKPVSGLSPRYSRPRSLEMHPVPSPFATRIRVGKALAHRPSVFLRAPGRIALAPDKPDALDDLVAGYCDRLSSDAVICAFRAGRAQGERMAADDRRPNNLLCDAVILSHRHHATTALAPILLATLVLFAQALETTKAQFSIEGPDPLVDFRATSGSYCA